MVSILLFKFDGKLRAELFQRMIIHNKLENAENFKITVTQFLLICIKNNKIYT